jgi:protein-disulfide isomerase
MTKFKLLACATLAILLSTSFTPSFAEEKLPSTGTTAPQPETAEQKARKAAQEEAAKTSESLEARVLLSQKQPYDIVIGKEDAPITLTEYASMSCSHCKAFYDDVFTKLKPAYIDSGKVKLVFRHFPLNINALRGAQILNCGVQDPEKQHVFLGAMFKSQEEWAYKEKEEDLLKKLEDIAKIGGIDSSKFASCLKNKETEDGLLRQQLQTQKTLGVNGTPALFIQDKQYYDKKDFETLSAALDNVLGGKNMDGTATEEKKK